MSQFVFLIQYPCHQSGRGGVDGPHVIGDVINHGKRKYWYVSRDLLLQNDPKVVF